MFLKRYNKILAALDAENGIKDDLIDAVDHGIIVSNLAGMLAREAGGSKEFCNEMKMAGIIHDVGKLPITKYLYGRKQDSLRIEELNYIRMHPTIGFQALKKVGGFSNLVVQAVYHHHENYDGSGYPDNLKGEDIPYAARILRICDVYAALISERPYRTAFDYDTALELMIDEVKNFDMGLFLKFLQMVHSEEIKQVWGLAEDANQRMKERDYLQEKEEVWEVIHKLREAAENGGNYDYAQTQGDTGLVWGEYAQADHRGGNREETMQGI